MVPVWLLKLATPLVTKLIKEKIGHVIGYVEEENELDIKQHSLKQLPLPRGFPAILSFVLYPFIIPQVIS